VTAAKKAAQVARLLALPVITIGGSVVAWKLGYFDLDRRREIAAFVERTRGLPVIQLLYVAGYAIVVAVSLPAVVATILGGAYFGWGWGGLLAWCGLLAGTALTHTLAARIARKPLLRVFGHHRLLTQLRENVGVPGLIRLRVLPVAPLGVLAYVAGIAGVPLRRLLMATAIAMIPSVVAYSYVGAQLMRGLADPAATERALRLAGYVTLGMLALSIVPNLLKKSRATPTSRAPAP
jgi:uncharacterized membrane protein YdjX (TVP38/TMEM64 family)